MRIYYGKLWARCVREGISKSLLFSKLGMSSQTLYVMSQNGSVSLKTIDKLCSYFKCQPSDIMEFLPEEEK